MNIFVLSEDPKEAAIFHNDSHCVKMVLESAQLLSTAHQVLDNNSDQRLYRSTHINHPCAIWTRKSEQNYLWLYNLFVELSKEYTHRYGKNHKSYVSLNDLLSAPPKNISNLGITERPKAMPEHCKTENVVDSYRNYYIKEKSKLARWKKRDIPYWFKSE